MNSNPVWQEIILLSLQELKSNVRFKHKIWKLSRLKWDSFRKEIQRQIQDQIWKLVLLLKILFCPFFSLDLMNEIEMASETKIGRNGLIFKFDVWT